MNTLFGLPPHPLWAHLTVVTMPVSAVLAGVIAVSPRAPRLVKVSTLPGVGAVVRRFESCSDCQYLEEF